MKTNKMGILLCNIGTPDKPTPTAVYQYLRRFLSDRRVVEIPRLFWWPILHGFILPFRSKKSAQLYQKIWTEQGSPLLYHSQQLVQNLAKKLELPVMLGMHYSSPSIPDALKKLQNQGIEKILILPLYPQYSATTTASTFDQVANTFKKWRKIPAIHMIRDYASSPEYIRALGQSILTTWEKYGRAQYLLFSFHSIPQQYITAGDPYREQCYLTIELLAQHLNLAPEEYGVSFQSRLGKTEWLKPYTDLTLQKLPAQGITDIQVICPGFAVDCLETLEEIALQGKKQFLQAGGKRFHYIPALNENTTHVEMLAQIIKKHFSYPYNTEYALVEK